MGALLDKAAILASGKTEDVECPSWGGTVRLRTMTAADRLAALQAAKDSPLQFGLHVLAASIVDEQGVRMFTPDEIAQAPSGGFEEAVAAAMRINGFAAKAVEDATGN